ncbi:MAG TPA: hypothetical protein DEV81_22530 [Cyanobacteria bacterium UBA11049]|nr:hypothetical protein [Cyanobacteria bacterium UBA11049]
MRVFVYGTLKPGESNYQRYCVGKVVEEKCAIALGQLFSLPFGYPAMTPGSSFVRGFLLSFADPQILPQLDWLEDYDPQRPLSENEYYRQQIEVYDRSLAPLGNAWAYFMTPARVNLFGGVPLTNGRWSSLILNDEC